MGQHLTNMISRTSTCLLTIIFWLICLFVVVGLLGNVVTVTQQVDLIDFCCLMSGA